MEIKLFCCDFISIFVAAVCEDGRHTRHKKRIGFFLAGENWTLSHKVRNKG